MKRKVRVLVADDHAILRAGLSMLINSQPDMEAVGEAGSGPEAVNQASALAPDVVVLDLTMPHTDASRTIRELATSRAAPRVLVLTMHDDPAYLDMAMSAGAHGFVTKKAADPELLAAIRAVHSGRQFVDATIDRRTGHRRLRQAATDAQRPRSLLSARESEVLRLLGAGYTNRAVAQSLGVSVKTVETYRSRLSEKLGLKGRADLVRYALQSGVLSAERLPAGDRNR